MSLLDEQLRYYRARAREYDEWFLRRGRYDRGSEANSRWRAEVDVVRAALDDFQPRGEVLEIACGTGNWTAQLAKHAHSVLAIDAAGEMLAINRQKQRLPNVNFVQADAFRLPLVHQFDAVFFGFWLSHVPRERFAPFWHSLRTVLRPDGRVFFVDSLPNPESQASNHPPVDAAAEQQTRYLNDGRRFDIVKRYYEPPTLVAELAKRGWNATIAASGSFFLYGSASLASAAGELASPQAKR